MARNRLLEGFTRSAGRAMQTFFAREGERQVADLRRGGTPASERAGMPYSVVSANGYDSIAEHLAIEQDLISRYVETEEMDDYPECATAFDVYADDATVPDMQTGKSLWIDSPNHEVKADLMQMLHGACRVEDDIWGSTRTLSKYGNDFGELLLAERGVVGINFMPPASMRRVEDERENLLGFVQDTSGAFTLQLDDFRDLVQRRQRGELVQAVNGSITPFLGWEVVHWRLRGKHPRAVYGHGVGDSARWIWKRCVLLEDAILLHQLTRAPSRYAFYVDIGELDMDRGMQFVETVRQRYKKQSFVNPTTGHLDMRFNPLGVMDDFWLASKGGRDSTRIEALNTPTWASTEVLEYHRDKLVSSFKIPKAYYGYGGEAVKGMLSSQDIRFARTVMRVQREERSGWGKVCRVHLIAQGMEPEDVEYEVMMSVPSSIMELAKLEVMASKADIADRLGERISEKWFLTKFMGFDEDSAFEIMRDREGEKLRGLIVDARGQVIAQAMADAEQAKWARGLPKESAPGADLEAPEDGGDSGGGGGGSGGAAPEEPEETEAPEGGEETGTGEEDLPRRSMWAPISKAGRKGRMPADVRFSKGDREGEKRADDRLVKMLSDRSERREKYTNSRLTELKGMLEEIRKTMRGFQG